MDITLQVGKYSLRSITLCPLIPTRAQCDPEGTQCDPEGTLCHHIPRLRTSERTKRGFLKGRRKGGSERAVEP